MRNQPFTLVELDIPVCSLTYGTAPCTASVPGTGAQKCFNTRRTCQDLEHLTPAVQTLRVCKPREDIPLEYDALPNLMSVNVTAGVIDPGVSIGTRGKVTISCGEHPSGDALFDRYLVDRAYDPFAQGTFWSRLRARQFSLQGIAVRVLRGQFGEPLDTFTVEHYIAESATLDADGLDLTAKDALSYCDPSKAQCPVLTTGRIAAALTAVATSVTLIPVGVGDLQYPSSGTGCLSNKEIFPFTRVGDVFTITRNGAYGSTVQAHEEDATLQVVQVFSAQSAAEIVHTLLLDFTPGIDSDWLDLAAWSEEADTYIGHLYTAVIPVPTSVKTLLDEMMVQAGCSLWWDPVAQAVKFQTLRPISQGAFVYDDTRIMAGSFQYKDQPDKRISDAWTWYGLKDATNKVDKEANFKAVVATPDLEAADDYGGPAYRKNLARWITLDNRAAASRLNDMLLARYRDPPRRAKLSLPADATQIPTMGQGIQVRAFSLQNPDGSPETVPFYVLSADNEEASVHLELEELKFKDGSAPANRAVYIDVDHFNVNLRELYDTLYSSVPDGTTVTFYVSPGAAVGGQVLGGRSMEVLSDDWPSDTVIYLQIAAPGSPLGYVVGRGGDGGGYPGPTTDGQDGSIALYVRRPITLRNYGTLAGGGGGGEGRTEFFSGDGAFYVAGGGGGAGFNAYNLDTTRRGGKGGAGVDGAEPGTITRGGRGASTPPGPGGRGGDLGLPGKFKNGASGNSDAGVAIDGVSFVTIAVAGTILGSQIN